MLLLVVFLLGIIDSLVLPTAVVSKSSSLNVSLWFRLLGLLLIFLSAVNFFSSMSIMECLDQFPQNFCPL